MDDSKHLDPLFHECFFKLAVHIMQNKDEIFGASVFDTTSRMTGMSGTSTVYTSYKPAGRKVKIHSRIDEESENENE